ncbi:uncharacterized protein A4U43_C09F3430 [Asparagus officinalis]|uniref:Uncharacterized protein n=1 Tax=Asparagus officinalis TaxID=4686 RepID=A0A5P1E4Z8_ASPOF|nr:uncharacterized protein LOC109824254 [Asparagus officinalis]XP_020246392.1 uncharacterized protein LOC109824254 [Asparagus officinalis]ONK57724.1 uncharacterized protein A4U43_C09F3430 [Asparagus officinalis]
MLTAKKPASPAKKPASALPNDDSYGDGLHKMTDQEQAIYAAAVRRSDGFDVPSLPDVFAIGLIQPAGRNFAAEFIRRYALIAIEDQNEKRKTEGGNQLRLKEVIKCNLRVACPADLYITLEAEDVDTREVDEYEALVMARCRKAERRGSYL